MDHGERLVEVGGSVALLGCRRACLCGRKPEPAARCTRHARELLSFGKTASLKTLRDPNRCGVRAFSVAARSCYTGLASSVISEQHDPERIAECAGWRLTQQKETRVSGPDPLQPPFMRLKMYLLLLKQRALENRWVVHGALSALVVWGFIQALVGRRAGAFKTLAQVHRTTRLRWQRRLIEPYILAHYPAIYGEPRPTNRPDFTKFFGRRLLVLKAPLRDGEKGVLFVSFSDMFRLLQAYMDVRKLLQDYTLVFEPSYPGFCHPELLKYTRWQDKIFVLAAPEDDFAFLRRLNSNLIPLDMGPADWVDPRVALPYLGNPKEFDIVMNSGWMALKRHYVLFRMLARAKQEYKVLLIGFPTQKTDISDIKRLADYYAVRDQLTIVEDIPYHEVMNLTCRSRVSVLLSLKEGGNRAVSESIFCDVPVLLLSTHVGGVKKNVVPETGVLAEEADLEAAITRLGDGNMSPRQWGLDHISCFKSSEELNRILRDDALEQRRPWTQDIAARSNSPDSSYTCLEDTERLRPWNEKLREYLTKG